MAVKDNPKIYFWASFFGSISFLVPVLTLFYLHRGLTLSDILILFVIDVVFSLIFEVPTGTFADKYGHKASLIVSQLIFILSIVLLIFAFDKWMFYLIAALVGISTTFHSGVKDALIYESLEEIGKKHTMSKVWGKIMSAPQIALAIAVIFGAYIAKDLTEMQFIIVIVLGIVFSLVKLGLLFKLTTPKSHELSRLIHPYEHLKEGFRFIRKSPYFLMAIGQMFIYIPFWAFREMAQPFLTNAGVAVMWFGLIYALSYLFVYFVLNKIEWFENKFKTKTLIYSIAILNLVAFLAAAFLGNILIVALIVFVALFVLRRLRTPIMTQVANDYITKSRSTVLSLFSGLDSLFDIMIIGTLAGLATISLPIVFIGCAVFILIGLFFPVRLASEVKS